MVCVRRGVSSGEGQRCQSMATYDIDDLERRDFEAGRPRTGRVPVERQQALLDEFEKSGASGANFARTN